MLFISNLKLANFYYEIEGIKAMAHEILAWKKSFIKSWLACWSTVLCNPNTGIFLRSLGTADSEKPFCSHVPPPGSALPTRDGVQGIYKWRAIMYTDYRGIIRKTAVLGISLVTVGGNHGWPCVRNTFNLPTMKGYEVQAFIAVSWGVDRTAAKAMPEEPNVTCLWEIKYRLSFTLFFSLGISHRYSSLQCRHT